MMSKVILSDRLMQAYVYILIVVFAMCLILVMAVYIFGGRAWI